jgi:hypothetical protein
MASRRNARTEQPRPLGRPGSATGRKLRWAGFDHAAARALFLVPIQPDSCSVSIAEGRHRRGHRARWRRVALLRAAAAIEALARRAEGDKRTGLHVLARALEEPTWEIAQNSGVDPGVAVDRARSGSGGLRARRRQRRVRGPRRRRDHRSHKRSFASPCRRPSPSPARCFSPRQRYRAAGREDLPQAAAGFG